VTQNIQGYLSSHPDVDGVLTLGSAIATNALSAVKKAGKTGKVKVGTITLSSSVLDGVKSGDLAYAVDEQPYLQGFYGMTVASQYARNKLQPTAPVLTGGLVIDRSNVDAALAVQEKYPGLRGAE